jgi:transcription termination factor Rho
MNDSHDFVDAFLKKLGDTKTNREFLDTLEAKPDGKRVKNSAS